MIERDALELQQTMRMKEKMYQRPQGKTSQTTDSLFNASRGTREMMLCLENEGTTADHYPTTK